jgi:hypothetical protein
MMVRLEPEEIEVARQLYVMLAIWDEVSYGDFRRICKECGARFEYAIKAFLGYKLLSEQPISPDEDPASYPTWQTVSNYLKINPDLVVFVRESAENRLELETSSDTQKRHSIKKTKKSGSHRFDWKDAAAAKEFCIRRKRDQKLTLKEFCDSYETEGKCRSKHTLYRKLTKFRIHWDDSKSDTLRHK